MKKFILTLLLIASVSGPAAAEITSVGKVLSPEAANKAVAKARSQVAFRKTAPLEVRNLAGEQVLLITADGKFMAHGKYIATDKEAVKIMIKYLHDEKCSTK